MVKFSYQTGTNNASHCQLSKPIVELALSVFFVVNKNWQHMLQVRVPCVLGNRKRKTESEREWERVRARGSCVERAIPAESNRYI